MKKKFLIILAIYVTGLIVITFFTFSRAELKKDIIFTGYYEAYHKYLGLYETFWERIRDKRMDSIAFEHILETASNIGYYLFVVDANSNILYEYDIEKESSSAEVRNITIMRARSNFLNYFSEVLEHQGETYIYAVRKIVDSNQTISLVILSNITSNVADWTYVKYSSLALYAFLWSAFCALYLFVQKSRGVRSRKKQADLEINDLVHSVVQSDKQALILLVNDESVIEFISPLLLNLLEYNESEIVGKHIKLLISDFDLQKLISLNTQVNEYEEGIEFISKYKIPFVLQMSFIPFFHSVTVLHKILFIFHDITQLKVSIAKLEFEIKKNISFLAISQLVMNVDDLGHISKMIIAEVRSLINFDYGTFFLLKDRELHPIFTDNPDYVNILDTIKIKIGEGVAGHVAESGKSIVVNDTANSEIAYHVEGTLDVDECLMCSPMTNSNGTIVGVVSFSRDSLEGFTDNDVQILETIAYHAANIFDKIELINKIKTDEKSHKTLINESALAIIIIHEHKIIFCNKKFCEMIKYEKGALLSYDIIELISKKDCNYFVSQLTTFALSGKTDLFDCEFITSENNTINLEFSLSSIIWDEKQSILISANDVTEKIAMNRRMLQNQKLEAIGTLTSGIAHDFKNILAGIIGAIELINLKTEDDSPVRPLVRVIRLSAERAVKLSQRLLGFSRKVDDVVDVFDLNNLVSETLEIAAFTFEKNIEINLELANQPMFFEGDPVKIQQCIMNICVNARDVMPKGGQLNVTTRFLNKFDEIKALWPQAENRNYSVIDIADSGPGIPEHIQNILFEPFFTTKEREKGTGLGLSITKNIITEYKGNIILDSTIGKGTTFSIILPWSSKEEAEIVTRINYESPKFHTIIVVDDEEIVLDIAKELLEELGNRVYIANNGYDAMAIIEENPEINIAILDRMMPQIGGLQLLKMIKEKFPDITVIIASGFLQNDIINELMANGAHICITKPYKIETLANILNEIE